MKAGFLIVLFLILSSSLITLQAQNDFAVLERNVNIRAKDLIHKLNNSKDTLLLESKNLIHSVYAVNMNYKREVDLVVRDNVVKIPLVNLTKGKHVFVAEQRHLRIVFVVKILRDDANLLAMESEKLISKE